MGRRRNAGAGRKDYGWWGFVSYSHYDKQYVIGVIEHLARLEFEVEGYDGMGGGPDEPDREEQIRTCAVFVPVVSVHCSGPGWVKDQTNLARALSRPIVALRLGSPQVAWLEGIDVDDVTDGSPVPRTTITR